MTALNHDILWSIFMLNASDQDFDDMTTIPLTTTIASSHVCRQWRQIILSSSQMWGRLFVVDGTYNRCCMEEVLTRSKVSPLWVYGYVVYGFMENYIEMDVTKEKERSAFFLQTVERNWERVEVLTYQSAWEGAHRKTELTSPWKFINDRLCRLWPC
ncbi:hypothetical protein CPC08DRAFT_263893 [Agrocybe pediades]|nr:hypothetical protein CPC08DRAFT_263893 [Agrocybe pediades]